MTLPSSVRSRLATFSLSLAAAVLLAAASLAPLPATGASAPAAGPYTGNVQSGIFHAPNCRYFDCKACKALFKTRGESVAAGYRPCMVCRP